MNSTLKSLRITLWFLLLSFLSLNFFLSSCEVPKETPPGISAEPTSTLQETSGPTLSPEATSIPTETTVVTGEPTGVPTPEETPNPTFEGTPNPTDFQTSSPTFAPGSWFCPDCGIEIPCGTHSCVLCGFPRPEEVCLKKQISEGFVKNERTKFASQRTLSHFPAKSRDQGKKRGRFGILWVRSCFCWFGFFERVEQLKERLKHSGPLLKILVAKGTSTKPLKPTDVLLGTSEIWKGGLI